MITVNERNENILACLLFVLYFGIGVLIRDAVIPYCNPALADFHVAMVYQVVPFSIIIGVGFGVVSFFFPKIKKPRVGQGIVTGFSTGFGVSTVIVLLLFIQCV